MIRPVYLKWSFFNANYFYFVILCFTYILKFCFIISSCLPFTFVLCLGLLCFGFAALRVIKLIYSFASLQLLNS